MPGWARVRVLALLGFARLGFAGLGFALLSLLSFFVSLLFGFICFSSRITTVVHVAVTIK